MKELTQDYSAVRAVQVEQPSAGDLWPVLHVLLQAFSIDLQGVFISKPADSIDVDGCFGVWLAHAERLLPHKFEHPIPSKNLLN